VEDARYAAQLNHSGRVKPEMKASGQLREEMAHVGKVRPELGPRIGEQSIVGASIRLRHKRPALTGGAFCYRICYNLIRG
jgi:hypothetical protein